jgi:glucose-6-phosphate 1-dehydrogenase
MAGPDVTDDQPTVFVLEGVTGDLAKRMVRPAFYDLYTRHVGSR